MRLSSILDRIRRFDAYPKTLEDFRIKTYSGAAVTIISAVIMTVLFLSELNYYLTPEVTEELFVDMSRGSKLRINLDFVFPKVSCSFLTIDAMDVSGAQHINVEHNIYKRRLALDGKPIEKPERETTFGDPVKEFVEKVKPTLDPNRCESCYGAETSEQKCCNTCEEVREAYRKKGWAFNPEKWEQCKREGWNEKIKDHDKEGCQIFGYLEVNRVGGNFHIAPGKSFSQHHVHIHDLQSISSSQFNLTHRVRHLSFGRNVPGKTNTLDGEEQLADQGGMMYHYYVKIVPTMFTRADGKVLHTNQYAVTRHQKQVASGSLISEHGLPGLFVTYEFAPLMVKYSEKQKSFLHFLTSVCAIIGGVFTVAGLVDSLIYHSAQAIQKKIELGKVN